jgi:cellulose synthase/poly-beta-1,6-N-acetylglucosamine synthase-like glycosyltransferase
MTALDAAFMTESPRLAGRRTPLATVLIHGGALLLWIVLFARAFRFDGVLAWSAGIVYVGYDTLLILFVFRQTLALMRASRVSGHRDAPASVTERPRVAAVVAARNEAAALPLTIARLLAQSDPPDLIVVADDGSTDGTPDAMAQHFGLTRPALGRCADARLGGTTLRWLRLSHGGKARALNAALPLADADVVLTIDADTLLAPDAVAAMRGAFAREPELVAATGVLIPTCGRGLGNRLFAWFQTYEYVRNFMTRFAWMRADCLLLISGAFAGFRRPALMAVGGFDPLCFTEDYELIHRLHRYADDRGLDWRVRVIGAARARTDAPGSIPAFLRQRRRWFGGFLQTQLWNRDMVGSRRYGAVGMLMMPVKAFDTLQPLYGLTAVAILFASLVTGAGHVAWPAFGVVVAKIVLDLGFYLWTVVLYRRWTGDADSTSLPMALLAAVIEPFTFQILRHLGAALGWVAFLRQREIWSSPSRAGIIAAGAD